MFKVSVESWKSTKDGSRFEKIAVRDTNGRFHGATNFSGTKR